MGGGGGGWNPISAITDPISHAIGTDGSGGGILGGLASIDPGPAIGGALASIDPGPAISRMGVAIDKTVNNVVPGGWTMVAAVTAAMVCPAIAGYLAAEGAAGATAAEFLAADAAAMASSGLSEAAIAQNLVAAGVDTFAAADAASLAASGLSEASIASTMASSYAPAEIFTSEAVNIAKAGETAITAAETAAQESANEAAFQTLQQGGTQAEAEAAAKAAAESATQGLPGAPAVDSVDVANTAKDIAQVRDAETVTNALEEASNVMPEGPTMPGPQNGITPEYTPPVDGSAPVYDYSTPADVATQQMAEARDAMPWWERAAENLSPYVPDASTIGQVGLGMMIAPSVFNALGLGPKAPGAATQAPLPPIPATKWGSTDKLVDPGVNPGWIHPTPVYQPTNPTDAQYYWGAHPYMAQPSDLAHYNAISNLPITPWGHHEQTKPLDVEQFTQDLLSGPYAGNQNLPAAQPIAPTGS